MHASGTCLGWLCWSMLVASSGQARAEPLSVSVEVDACVPIDHAQLQRLLAIELRSAEIHKANAATQIAVDCVGQGIELRLEDAVTGKSMRRLLAAASFRDASRTRLLALVVAEFVVASWVELNVRRRSSVTPLVPEVTPEVTPEMRRSVQRVLAEHTLQPDASGDETSLSLAVSSQYWAAQQTVFFGAGVRWLRAMPLHLALTAGGEVASASTDLAAGSVDAVTGSLEFAVALCMRLTSIALYSGPGGRVGMVSLQGTSSNSELQGFRFVALYGGPIWFNRIEYRASARLRVAVDVEASLTTLPVQGTAPSGGAPVDVFVLDGFSLNAALALALTL